MRPHARGAIALLAAAAALALSCDGALAAAGKLDPAFDTDGRRVLPFAARPAAVLVQRDGKLVVAGTNADNDFAAWRLTPSGALDPTFDRDGVATIHYDAPGELTAAALQADGKIVLAGVTHPVKGALVELARLNANGTPDDTFKPGGDPMLAGSGGLDTIASVLVQRDGHIVLVGRTGDDFGVIRLYPGGSNDGTAFEPIQFGGLDTPTAAALQRDGGIVVAGTSAEVKALAAAPSAVIARYKTGGEFDEDFKKRTLGTGTPAAVLVQRDGKIAAALRSAGADSQALVARLSARGEPDTAYGRGGTAVVDLHGPDIPAGAALQRDGRILVAGSAGYDFSAARLTAGGALDSSYGSGGGTVFGFSGVNRAWAAALQPDGRLVIAGQATVGAGERLAIARLLPDPARGGGPAGPGPIVPRCGGRRATIVGTAGADTLRGTRHADVIVARAGDDRVLARGGNDIVCGGSGRDRLSGGPGRDLLRGQGGRDVLRGGPGRDRLVGGPGRDRLAKEPR